MRNIVLDFRPRVGPHDADRLESLLHAVEADEQVTLVFDRADSHEIDDLLGVLHAQDFDFQPKGGHEDEYYILAQRHQYQG